MTTLPNKLSDLLELAVRDAQACEAQPERFRLHMGHWMTEDRGVCLVCMGGAVMAKTLGVAFGRGEECHPNNTVWRAQLFAIDSMRIGDFFDAASELGVELETSPQKVAIDRCERMVDASRFSDELRRADWETYLQCAVVLREAGL